ncbi:MAG: hypothetical protein AABX75_00950 [Nanoarchaeota archaeon]
MKLLYVVLDGAGDEPIEQLKGKTPLEFAKTPNLDKIALKSRLGIMHLLPHGIAPESDEAALALLGFDPFRFHKGRGPLEAFGAGIIGKNFKNKVILRCNFAKISGNEIINTEYVPTKEEIKKIEAIGIKNAKFKYTYGHRGVLILSGSDRISNTNPAYQIVADNLNSQRVQGMENWRKLRALGRELEPVFHKVTTALPKDEKLFLQQCRPLDSSASAKGTAELVNLFTKKTKDILGNKVIISRGAGSSLPKIKMKGRWTMLADSLIDRAIGKLAGMHVVEKQINYEKLFSQIKSRLSKGNVYVQIKKPDSLAHKGDFKGKAKEFEKLDRELFSNILKLKSIKLCITADHCTSSKIIAHTSAPVPVLLYDGKKADSIRRFSENCCRYGSLGLLHGTELFKIIEQ